MAAARGSDRAGMDVPLLQNPLVPHWVRVWPEASPVAVVVREGIGSHRLDSTWNSER
jgi:hypothetical protein